MFVALDDEATVAGLRPDLGRPRAIWAPFSVSCFAGAGTVKTRMFGPGIGVREDPATGSAAGPLAVHLARHGRIEFGQRIEIRQGAEIARPSVCAQVDGAAERIERVAVGGGR